MSTYYTGAGAREPAIPWSADADGRGSSWGWKWSGGGAWGAAGGEASRWGAAEAAGGWGAQSWYRPARGRWEAEGRPPDAGGPGAGAAAAPAPPPERAEGALAALEEAREAARASGGRPPAAAFCRAIQLCAASGDSSKALDLLDEMRDDHELDPDAATYASAIDACEGEGEGEGGAAQPLERVWLVLDEMRRQGLEPAAAPPRPEPGGARWGGASRGLRRHASAWLGAALPPAAAPAALRVAGLLRASRPPLEAAREAAPRRALLAPLLAALRAPAPPGAAPAAALLRAPAGLGAFTAEALEELALGGFPAPWRRPAAEELRRHRLLRRWALWEGEADRPGALAWLAYDLGGGEGAAAWDLSSSGEVFGASAAASREGAGPALLPAMAPDARSDDAEQRALLALVDRIFEKFPTGSCEGLSVEGIVMLYSLQPPSVASIFAMKQFLRLFPWVRLCADYGAGGGRGAIQRIGEPKNGSKCEAGTSWSKWTDWREGSGNGWTAQGSLQNNGPNGSPNAQGLSESGVGSNGTGPWSRWV